MKAGRQNKTAVLALLLCITHNTRTGHGSSCLKKKASRKSCEKLPPEHHTKRASNCIKKLEVEQFCSVLTASCDKVLASIPNVETDNADYDDDILLCKMACEKLISDMQELRENAKYNTSSSRQEMLSLAKNCSPLILTDALLTATQESYIIVVRFLLNAGANPRSLTPRLDSPLHLTGNVKIATELLRHGAEIDAKGYYEQTPLFEASKHGHVKVAELLIKHGADTTIKTIPHKRTPLHIAAGRGNARIVHLLLAHDADMEAVDYRNKKPIHYAIRATYSNRSSSVIRMLLEYGACMEENNSYTQPIFETA